MRKNESLKFWIDFLAEYVTRNGRKLNTAERKEKSFMLTIVSRILKDWECDRLRLLNVIGEAEAKK